MVINMYFHNGDYQPRTIFNKNECTFEEVFVSGLNTGYYLKSEIPYFFSSSNGHLSISEQIRTFGHYDSDHALIETINLTFITECQPMENPAKEQGKQGDISTQSLFLLFLVSVLAIIIFNQRRKKHAENRILR